LKCSRYSHFPSSVAEAVIANEISYFATLRRSFEWKVYSHDEPPDLHTRLQNRGFNIGAEESLMILDLRELSPDLLAPNPEGITVTAVPFCVLSNCREGFPIVCNPVLPDPDA
jgi:hypothetical protein